MLISVSVSLVPARPPCPRGSGGVRFALGAFRPGGPGPAERHRQRLLHQGGGADRQERPVQRGGAPAAGQLQGRQVRDQTERSSASSSASPHVLASSSPTAPRLHSTPVFTFDLLFCSFFCSALVSSPPFVYKLIFPFLLLTSLLFS